MPEVAIIKLCVLCHHGYHLCLWITPPPRIQSFWLTNSWNISEKHCLQYFMWWWSIVPDRDCNRWFSWLLVSTPTREWQIVYSQALKTGSSNTISSLLNMYLHQNIIPGISCTLNSSNFWLITPRWTLITLMWKKIKHLLDPDQTAIREQMKRLMLVGCSDLKVHHSDD